MTIFVSEGQPIHHDTKDIFSGQFSFSKRRES